MSATAKQIQQPASQHQLEAREFPTHTCYSGSIAELEAAGVMLPGFKYPAWNRDKEFIGENGYRYLVGGRHGEPGVFDVFVSMPAAVKEAQQHDAAIYALQTLFALLPGKPLALVKIARDGAGVEGLRFGISQRGGMVVSCARLDRVMEIYAQELAIARGQQVKPVNFQHVRQPEAAPVKRRRTARVLEAA